MEIDSAKYILTTFTYEEQGDKRYLVYEKKPEDSLDTLTLEMISNNKINGLAPANHMQMDDKFYVKYDISGCQSLREYLQGTVNRQQLLGIMEAIADTAMEAEDYMLKLSSYVLDADHMYIDKNVQKVFIIVLPIVREELPLEIFLKELLMGVRYNQTEDCSYVAALLNFFSSSDSFSACALKEQIVRLKKVKSSQKKADENKIEGKNIKTPEKRPEKSQRGETKRQSYEKNKINPVNSRSNDPEKQNCLDILFSEEEEEKTLKEKIGMLFKREKSDKDPAEEESSTEKEEKEQKEKKGLFGKKSEKKKKDREKFADSDPMLAGIAIPGMEIPGRSKDEAYSDKPSGEQEKGGLSGKYKKQDAPIPAQKVRMKKKRVKKSDFGETEYMQNEEDEETELLGQCSSGKPEFTLYRPATGEMFLISGDIVRVGRSSSIVEICITGNKCVGRIHAILYVRDGKVFIKDNYSKNCTFVDGIQLDPESPPVRLEHGSQIRLGDEELELHIEVG